MIWNRLIPFCVLLAGLTTYHSAFQGVFVFDDGYTIVTNDKIRHLWPPWTALGGTSRPLVQLSLALNYTLGKLDPWGYHLFNLVVHLLAGLTLYGVVKRTLVRLSRASELQSFRALETTDIVGQAHRLAKSLDGEPAIGGAPALQFSVVSLQSSVISPSHAIVLAGIISLIWVVHPLNTQAVTYIIQRGESMMGLFYLLTLYCFIRGVDQANGGTCSVTSSADTNLVGQAPRFAGLDVKETTATGVVALQSSVVGRQPSVSGLRSPVSGLQPSRVFWLVASVLSCTAGMLCKEVMFTAPFMVLIYDWVFVSHGVDRALRSRPWFYAVLWGTCLIPVYFTFVNDAGEASAGFGLKTISWDVYAVSQPRVILRYLRLVVHPVGLCLDYTWPVQRGFSEIAPSMAVVMALIGFTIWCWWRYRPLAFPSIWFFGILSVTSSVMPVADLAVEHRMYLPLIGPITLLVLAGNWAFHMRLKNAPHRRIQTAWIAAGTVVIIVLSLIRLTDARNRDYHDRFVMWSKVAEQRPHNYRAQTILAGYLIDRNELDAAIALAQHVVTERDPGYFPAHYKLALAYYTKGRDADAWRHLERALSIYPSHAEAHNLMGLIRYRQGRSQEATDFYRRAIALDPYRAQYHHNFGLALMKQEDWSAAATAFRDETELQPDAIESFHGLGYVLARQGNYQDALLAWRRTLEINPQFWPTVYEVAWVLATCPENGIRDGAEALRLAHRLPFDPKKPNSARLEVLAAAYAETGQFSEAIKTAEQMQQLPVVSGTSLIPVTGREERLSLYKAGRPYRLQSIHGDFESK